MKKKPEKGWFKFQDVGITYFNTAVVKRLVKAELRLEAEMNPPRRREAVEATKRKTRCEA